MWVDVSKVELTITTYHQIYAPGKHSCVFRSSCSLQLNCKLVPCLLQPILATSTYMYNTYV